MALIITESITQAASIRKELVVLPSCNTYEPQQWQDICRSAEDPLTFGSNNQLYLRPTPWVVNIPGPAKLASFPYLKGHDS